MHSTKTNAMAAACVTLTRLLLAVLLLGSLASALPGEGRILDGEDAASSEFPWLGSLRVRKTHSCGCVIISATQVLTAGHCVSKVGTTPWPVEDISLRVGSINQFAGGSIVEVASILIHPSYGNFLHDIALLTLRQPLSMSSKVAAATLPALPTEGEPIEQLPNGTPLSAAGWGELSEGGSSYKLQKSSFESLSEERCELQAGYGYESVLCLSHAEQQGVGHGDAGGGVFDADNVLQGIISFAFGAGGTKYPDVAARVSYYNEWIALNRQ